MATRACVDLLCCVLCFTVVADALERACPRVAQRPVPVKIVGSSSNEATALIATNGASLPLLPIVAAEMER